MSGEEQGAMNIHSRQSSPSVGIRENLPGEIVFALSQVGVSYAERREECSGNSLSF